MIELDAAISACATGLVRDSTQLLGADQLRLVDQAVAIRDQLRRKLAVSLGLDPDKGLGLVTEFPPPPASPYGVSDRGAEELAAAWLKHLGVHDATTTRFSGDGGADVASEQFRIVAQVKNWTSAVGVADIRQLAGVCATENVRGLFFASGGYAQGAIDFAGRASIALFHYKAEDGQLLSANPLAQIFLDLGFAEPPLPSER